VQEKTKSGNEFEQRALASEERLRFAEAASGIATFDLDLESGNWTWSPQAALLFGLTDATLDDWEQCLFPDDLLKLQAAAQAAKQTGSFNVEFRTRHKDKGILWMAGRGQVAADSVPGEPRLRGALFEITDRKALEARLLAMNETLEARVAEARQEARALEILNQVGTAVAAEHDLERLVQAVTDAASSSAMPGSALFSTTW
jgi:PAS fold